MAFACTQGDDQQVKIGDLRKSGQDHKNRANHINGGIDLKKAILMGLILVAFVGLSAAQLPYGWYNAGGTQVAINTEKNLSLNFEQSVQGSGYYTTYAYVKMGNLALKNHMHGSGQLTSDTVLAAYKKESDKHPWYLDWTDMDTTCIQFKEDNQMIYAPFKMAVGNGYYAMNPVDFSVLIKENSWVKNYRAGTSMQHEVEYAHALDKKLDITAKENYTHIFDPVWEGYAYTNMKVEEDVTDGKVHIGVLQARFDNADVNAIDATGTAAPGGQKWPRDLSDASNLNPDFGWTSAWYHPAVEIDEDYWGTYHIVKNMTLEVPYRRVDTAVDWLPCCSGGYLTMAKYEQMGTRGFGSNVKPVFDCTCSKYNLAAEFPEDSGLTPIKVGKY
jgi:hypothetical protein